MIQLYLQLMNRKWISIFWKYPRIWIDQRDARHKWYVLQDC